MVTSPIHNLVSSIPTPEPKSIKLPYCLSHLLFLTTSSPNIIPISPSSSNHSAQTKKNQNPTQEQPNVRTLPTLVWLPQPLESPSLRVLIEPKPNWLIPSVSSMLAKPRIRWCGEQDRLSVWGVQNRQCCTSFARCSPEVQGSGRSSLWNFWTWFFILV